MTSRDDELSTILYRSTSRADGYDMIKSISDILSVSARRNLRDKITGIFIHHEGSFFQILEGHPEKVEACYARILADTRHDNVEKLADRMIDRRKFSRWSMAFVDTSEIDDYASINRLLISDQSSDVFEAMSRIGSEHGLVQLANV